MGAYDLKQAFSHLPGIDRLTIAHRGNGNQVISIGDRQVEVGPMATNEDIERALTNPWAEPKRQNMTTIGELLKSARADIASARQGAAHAVAESADATKVVLQEVDKLRKEAADLRAEVAELTNGGPE